MRFTILVCLLLLHLQSTLAAGTSIRPQPNVNNVWFEYNDSDTVFVFVHGILSDSRDSWYFPGGLNSPPLYWPELVKSSNFKNPSIFLGGFYTKILSGDYRIRDASEELFSYLSVSKKPATLSLLQDKKNIVFVAHSLGGIVVRHMLTKKWDQFSEKNIGLVLFASPSLGSKDSDRLDYVLRLVNQKMAQELKWNDPNLRELDSDFRNLVDANRNRNLVGVEAIENQFYENLLSLFGRTVVVNEESGGRYFGAPIRIRGSDHSSIVKPTSELDHMHIVLRQFYEYKFLPLVLTNSMQEKQVNLDDLSNTSVDINFVEFKEVLVSRYKYGNKLFESIEENPSLNQDQLKQLEKIKNQYIALSNEAENALHKGQMNLWHEKSNQIHDLLRSPEAQELIPESEIPYIVFDPDLSKPKDEA